MQQGMTDDLSEDRWNTPELVAFREAAHACYLAGEDYKTLKNIIATEDELTPLEQRKIDPANTVAAYFNAMKPPPVL